jgi:hypothetical protein
VLANGNMSRSEVAGIAAINQAASEIRKRIPE